MMTLKVSKKKLITSVGDLFESSEALFGKGQYNTYINKLNRLKDRAKTAARILTLILMQM